MATLKAENLGVEIYPGFAASDIIVEGEKLSGIVTGDLGLNKDGSQVLIFSQE